MHEHERTARRPFLAGAAATGLGALAGCTGLIGSDDEDDSSPIGQIGSEHADRPEPGGTPIADLPALEGELTLYSGRASFLVAPLLEYLEDAYAEFTVETNYGGSAELVNAIDEEGAGTNADVFFTVDAGSLGALADLDRTRELSSETTDMVDDDSFHTDDWVGTSGRMRSIPYNTDALSDDDVPDSIEDYPSEFDGTLGWAPEYPSCQAFITTMRILEDDEYARSWLETFLEADPERYGNELAVCQAIAAGEIEGGLTNHYYIQRVQARSEDAPIATHFTEGDAGATFDVAGAAVVDETDDADLAETFVRHLLSSEAQEFFAVETQEYPLIEGVSPVGDLPSIDELDVPEVDPSQLADVSGTIGLMRDAGVDL